MALTVAERAKLARARRKAARANVPPEPPVEEAQERDVAMQRLIDTVQFQARALAVAVDALSYALEVVTVRDANRDDRDADRDVTSVTKSVTEASRSVTEAVTAGGVRGGSPSSSSSLSQDLQSSSGRGGDSSSRDVTSVTKSVTEASRSVTEAVTDRHGDGTATTNAAADGAFGALVTAWAEGIGSVTGEPYAPPRGRPAGQLAVALRGRCAGSTDAARALGVEYARAHPGRTLNALHFGDWLGSGRPAPLARGRLVQPMSPPGERAWKVGDGST